MRVLTRPWDSPLPRLCSTQGLSWLRNCEPRALLLSTPWPHHCQPSAGFPCLHHSAKITVQSVLSHRGQSFLIDNASQPRSQDLVNSGFFLRSWVVFHPALQITRVGGLWNPEALSWFSDFAGNRWASVSALCCHPWFDYQARKQWNGWSQPTLALLGHLLAPSELLLLPRPSVLSPPTPDPQTPVILSVSLQCFPSPGIFHGNDHVSKAFTGIVDYVSCWEEQITTGLLSYQRVEVKSIFSSLLGMIFQLSDSCL